MRVFELGKFHLDDMLRTNNAVVPLQPVFVGMDTKSHRIKFFCGNTGIVVTWGWTIFLVVAEAGLAFIHQGILEDSFHSHDWVNILRGKSAVDAAFGKHYKDTAFENSTGVGAGNVTYGGPDHLHEVIMRDGYSVWVRHFKFGIFVDVSA